MRLLFAALIVLSGCDTSEPPAFVLEAVQDGGAVVALEVEPSRALERVPGAEVALAPFREPPAEPDLAEQFRVSQVIAAGLSLVTGETYVAGYYRLRDLEPDALGLASAPCAEACIVLVLNDSRLVEGGAVFFSVLEGAALGPSLGLRPFGVGAAGSVTVEGAGQSETVAVPAIGEPTAVLEGATETVRVVREASETAAFVVVRRGADVRTRVLEAARPSLEVGVPKGVGAVEVYVLEGE